MPDKVTISHRGTRYEIGQGKRFYGIWVAGAPESDPVDRWPETREGWAQAWSRFVSMESPQAIRAVEQPRRPGFKFPRIKIARAGGSVAGSAAARVRLVAGVFLGLGVVLGIAGLFPDYFTGQSLASQADQLVPHLFYLAGWAASAVLVLRGRGTTRVGALLGIGLSAVTLGLFLSDLGEVISGESGLGAGMIIGIIGWAACTAGAGLALTVRPAAAATAATAPGTPAVPVTLADPDESTASDTLTGSDMLASSDTLAEPDASTTPGSYAVPGASTTPGPYAGAGPYPGYGAYAASPSAASSGTVGAPGRPVRPRAEHLGPIALLVLGAIGAVAAFAPSWDSYTLTASTGSQTVTAGNAFSDPGWVIAGNVLVMVAVVVVAVLAALWRPMRQGAALLGGAIIPMAAQAISALIQVSQPSSPTQFGISPSQASAAGLSITNGVTPIFWVYCVFVIALVISCAWMMTEPAQPAAPASPQPSWPGPFTGPIQPADADDESDSDTDDDAVNATIDDEIGHDVSEDSDDKDDGPEDGGTDGHEENTYA